MNLATLIIIFIGSTIQMIQSVSLNTIWILGNEVNLTLDFWIQILLIGVYFLALFFSTLNLIIKNEESFFYKFLLTSISSALFFANLTWIHNFY